MKKDPSAEFISLICSLYNDHYDDREEDSSIGGEDWTPGVKANHQSLAAFQKELRDFLRLSRPIPHQFIRAVISCFGRFQSGTTELTAKWNYLTMENRQAELL